MFYAHGTPPAAMNCIATGFTPFGQTIDRAELTAIYHALAHANLDDTCTEVYIYTDSQYAIDVLMAIQFGAQFARIHKMANADLLLAIIELQFSFDLILKKLRVTEIRKMPQVHMTFGLLLGTPLQIPQLQWPCDNCRSLHNPGFRSNLRHMKLLNRICSWSFHIW